MDIPLKVSRRNFVNRGAVVAAGCVFSPAVWAAAPIGKLAPSDTVRLAVLRGQPDRPRSAMDSMLKLAREGGSAKQTLVSRLPQAQQLKLEHHNVEESLNYAREKLKL